MDIRKDQQGTNLSLDAIIEEIQQKHHEQILLIEKKNTEALHSLIGNYERQLKEKQKLFETRQSECDLLFQNTLQKEIAELKGSWSWRIGFFQTASIRLLINFLKNPGRFITNERVRWNNIYYFIDPENKQPSKSQEKSGDETQTSTMPVDCIIEIDPGKQTFLCIMDTFTKSCFAPEFNILSPTPDNWKKVLETQEVNAIFVESAWHGNDNTWESLTSSYAGPKKLETLKDLISTGKKKGIPSMFWNKEDPVHFTRFLDTAKLCDFVFTSDAEIVPKYVEQLGHKNVFPLPFAAQHKIHNPIRDCSRDKTVSFAGSYYNFSYAERKLDMDILLQPAMAYGLEIFDRNYGVTGVAAEQFGFPAIYKSAIRGKLEYADMLNAYKAYKVFLNVNSVKYSSTMFARRVFELLACGTPVISNYSKGIIRLLGEGTVFIAENENDTRKYLDKLLGDQHFWWKTSLHGMRKVIERHTYQDLTEEIFSKTGQPFVKPPAVTFQTISVLNGIEDARYLSEIVRNQVIKPTGMIFVEDTGANMPENAREELSNMNPGIKVEFVNKLDEKAIRSAVVSLAGTYIALLNPGSYYGPNYLRDYALAVKYSDAQVMGKTDTIARDGSGNIVIPVLNGDFRWVDRVPTASLVMDRSLVPEMDLLRIFRENFISIPGTRMFSLDPFNFYANGRAEYEKSQSWLMENIGI